MENQDTHQEAMTMEMMNLEAQQICTPKLQQELWEKIKRKIQLLQASESELE